MSTTEILEELPNLKPAELETIYRRAMELHQRWKVEATPELLAPVDEANAEASTDQAKENMQLRKPSRLAERWAGKFQLPTPDSSDPRLTFLLGRYLRDRS